VERSSAGFLLSPTMGERMSAHAQKSSVAMLSVLSNTFLVSGKLIIGLMIGSVSVISEAIHSGVDLLAAVIALIAVKNSDKPADEEHPFGHGKFENISGTIEALLIFVAAAWIISEAVSKLRHNEPVEFPLLGIIIMFISAIVNIIISKRLFKIGTQTDSQALLADAWHLRTDVWTSFGVMAGLVIILVVKYFIPSAKIDWVDPVAAIIVALFIIKAAWELTVQAGRDLLDVSLPKDEEDWIRNFILNSNDNIYGMHKLRTRKAGATRFIEFHLTIKEELNVAESHEIADDIILGIREKYGMAEVHIHVEPCNASRCTIDCEKVCRRNDKKDFKQVMH
jgi:cation diffusion facilitator family transporter